LDYRNGYENEIDDTVCRSTALCRDECSVRRHERKNDKNACRLFQHVAERIASLTGGTLFRIEPEKPYPAEYKPCTEVAKAEKEADARPAIKSKVESWEQYDTVFIGCPVWWWTAPMIINTFAESYDFRGKTVVPFCTYAATYRDETLARIRELTPAAEHLKGFGTTGKDTNGVESWLRTINVIR